MNRVALIQMASTGDLEANLAQASQFLKQAKSDGISMAILPETWATLGMTDVEVLAIQESYGHGPIQEQVAAWAKNLGIWIVAGTLPLQTTDFEKTAASCLVFDEQGNIQARYDKIHLFDVTVNAQGECYQESSQIVPGQEVVVLDTPIGKVGLAICYDLRFPELFRALIDKGAQVIVVPAAFTIPTGELHWALLNRVRAVENLTYVVAVDQVGKRHNGRGTFGHSMVVDPWGEILVELDEKAEVGIAEINLSYLEEVRSRFPALSHRKL